MYDIILGDEGISFFSCFLDGNISPTLPLSEGLAFKNNHFYYYSTSQSGNSKKHRIKEKTTLEQTNKQTKILQSTFNFLEGISKAVNFLLLAD